MLPGRIYLFRSLWETECRTILFNLRHLYSFCVQSAFPFVVSALIAKNIITLDRRETTGSCAGTENNHERQLSQLFIIQRNSVKLYFAWKIELESTFNSEWNKIFVLDFRIILAPNMDHSMSRDEMKLLNRWLVKFM